MTDHLADRCAVLEAENDELRERIILLERALTAGYGLMPIGGLTSTETVVVAVIAAAPEGAAKQRIFESLYAMRASGEVPDMRIIDVLVCKIRRKLGVYGIEIETVWGWGYRIPREGREKLDEMRKVIT